MNFIKKMVLEIGILFMGLENWLQKVAVPTTILVGNELKVIVDDDPGDIIGNVAQRIGIYGGAAAEDKIRSGIPKVLALMPVAQQFMALADHNEILKSVLKLVNTYSLDVRTLFWVNFTALLNTDFSGGHMTVQESVQALQYAYKNYPWPTHDNIDFSSETSAAPATLEDKTVNDEATQDATQPEIAAPAIVDAASSPTVIEGDNLAKADVVAPAAVVLFETPGTVAPDEDGPTEIKDIAPPAPEAPADALGAVPENATVEPPSQVVESLGKASFV